MIASHKDLDAWLDAATWGLCAEAKERIAEEIRSHVEQSTSAMEQEAVPEHDRAALAIKRLGSARVARRAYRRQYLTWMEAQNYGAYSREIEGRGRTYAGLTVLEWLMGFVCCGWVFLIASSFGKEPQHLVDGLFFMALLLSGWSGLIARIVTHRVSARVGLASYFATACASFFMMAVWAFATSFHSIYDHTAPQGYPIGSIAIGFFALAAGALFSLQSVRTWRKIQSPFND